MWIKDSLLKLSIEMPHGKKQQIFDVQEHNRVLFVAKLVARNYRAQ